MAATNDTIDGLLAEFRGYAAGMPPSYHVTMSWADFRKMLDRFEAANKREHDDCAKLREAITPKSDPDWKDICAKCKDGDIEPNYCKYYGEPNGCNSPIYGEHPSTPNAAAMHACLLKILAEMIDLGGMEAGRKARFSPDAIAEEIRQALSAPPRNCDVGTAEELYERYEKFCCSHFNNEGDNCLKCPFSQPTCKFAWAQLPYEEGGAK